MLGKPTDGFYLLLAKGSTVTKGLGSPTAYLVQNKVERRHNF
uniref:Uncharacterized protein n=1 Tax=Anguilla anguilla TaxID=7936 RepID=A0A0E9VKR4_ANGAN